MAGGMRLKRPYEASCPSFPAGTREPNQDHARHPLFHLILCHDRHAVRSGAGEHRKASRRRQRAGQDRLHGRQHHGGLLSHRWTPGLSGDGRDRAEKTLSPGTGHGAQRGHQWRHHQGCAGPAGSRCARAQTTSGDRDVRHERHGAHASGRVSEELEGDLCALPAGWCGGPALHAKFRGGHRSTARQQAG